jgi:hypothetical protein
MRLPLLPPTALSPEQRSLYDDMKAGIQRNFFNFKAIDDNGALLGPGIRGCTSRNLVSRFGSWCSPCRRAAHERAKHDLPVAYSVCLFRSAGRT